MYHALQLYPNSSFLLRAKNYQMSFSDAPLRHHFEQAIQMIVDTHPIVTI